MRYIPSTATLLTAAIALLGAALPLARVVNHGVELSWDAINYAAVARSLLDGAGFVNYNGTPYTEWPPLYPLLLAAASGFGILDPRAVAGPLNALLFGLTIFPVGCYLRRRLNSPFLAVWATLAIALALPLAESVTWGLAGAPFILLTTLALLQTDRYLTDRKTPSLLWAALFCALAWQTRYLGAAVAVAIGLLLLFAPPPPDPMVPQLCPLYADCHPAGSRLAAAELPYCRRADRQSNAGGTNLAVAAPGYLDHHQRLGYEL